MTLGSLFAGIGGFDLAAERCGIEVRWQVEIDRFARRVLSRRWPNVRRYDDVRAVDPGGLEPVDILCGGWPCQGNSIAGKRGGHDDERSGLFSEILRIADGMDPRPRFLLLENVPGLLSVNSGRDFAGVVGELSRRGYVGCVRRLDARYFGLAQRRSRLFFVAGLGAEGLAAVHAVLEGGRRHPAPRREAREDVAGPLGGGSEDRGWCSDTERMSFVPVASVPLATKDRAGNDMTRDQLVVPELARCIATGSNPHRYDGESETFIAEVERPLRAQAQMAHREDADTLVGCFGLSTSVTPKFAEECSPTLCQPSPTGGGLPAAVAFNHQTGGDMRLGIGDTPSALQASQTPAVLRASTVRRLTPTECEMLQGAPVGHTCLCGRNEGRSWPEEDACTCPDGPRYRALGNSVAVPCVEWLLRRIQEALR